MVLRMQDFKNARHRALIGSYYCSFSGGLAASDPVKVLVRTENLAGL